MRFIFCLLLITQLTQAQKTNLVYVDKQGIMRYTRDNKEAAFFGVNYTTPFAHAYRAHKAMGIDIEKAIQQDVYHLSRLGLDAFRVHVWDTEISDSAGNLLNNDHLRLFDFLLAELKKRNIKTIITPIAFWGNGYPDRDEATPGFSRKYGKGKATVNDTAIKAQENYLQQFFRHVNPYTKLTYGNDPDVIAVELNNEPSHSNPKSGITAYINRLVNAVKSTGFNKPLFYNISQNPWCADAVAASDVVGFSFQWYPTGLVAGHELKGNFLPHVDKYHIPFDTIPAFAKKALMVYEFDAADLLQSNMYPAMARSYRQAGFQWATQFAYDPMAIAQVNTEYQTHYLNLAYTPGKAISMLIASEVFHKWPRSKNAGAFPADTVFDAFSVSYKQQLSEMNTAQQFYYSNTTQTKPVNSASLQHVAGVGQSPIVIYTGSGAYFLDKIEAGVWRLELMPDAIHAHDPFEKTSPDKMVTGIEWNTHPMQVMLPDLGKGFSIKGLNEGNRYAATANGDRFDIQPGAYLLVKNGKSAGNASKEFAAPAARKVDRQPVAIEKIGLVLYNPATDKDLFIYPGLRRNAPNNTDTVLTFKGTVQHYIGGRLAQASKLFIRARGAQTVKITLINADAVAMSTTIQLSASFSDLEVPLNDLKPDSALLLPRPYPGFQPLWFKAGGVFDWREAERIQVSAENDIEIASIYCSGTPGFSPGQ
jgi:hypothetical protein